MPPGDAPEQPGTPPPPPPSNAFSRQAHRVRDLFTIPAPVKKLFDLVPVVTYPPNDLPQRSARASKLPSLYVFSSPDDAASGRPSYNPSCLKWQAYLRFAGIQHTLISSNNHASPTGVLPFLLPAVQATQSGSETSHPIPSNKITKYASERGVKIKECASPRYDAYKTLIDYRIRNAWLLTLYLDHRNFHSVARRLYVEPISSNPAVRFTIAHQLRTAAEAEILKQYSIIDVDDLYSEADKAFEALSALLGEDEWFFGSESPTLFDASVFAYTHLLLDDSLGWKEKKLARAVRKQENLVQHRERIVVKYF